jgi:hemolysin activation/secretion protein
MGHFTRTRLSISGSGEPRSRLFCPVSKDVSLPTYTVDVLSKSSKRLRAVRRSYAAIAIILLSSAQAAGQSITSEVAANQELLREQVRTRELREKQERTTDVHLPRGAKRVSDFLKFDESPCFVINEIVLAGDSTASSFNWALVAAGRAGAATDSAIGRCVGTDDIYLLVRRVQNEILRRGYVTTRVLLTPQDIKSKTLTLTLVPGRIRTIRDSDENTSKAMFANAVPSSPGQLLNLRDIEQALENFKRLPSVQADIQIVPADGGDARPGESDLVINWKQKNRFRINVLADDSGSRATGKYQGSVTLAYDNPLSLNDLLYATISHDVDAKGSQHGTRGATLHYSVPFNYWLLGLTGSSNPYYQSVVGATQTYVYRGESRNANISLSRLVYRDANQKTTVSLSGWARASRNYIDDTEVEVQRRRTAGWELGLTHRQVVGSGAIEVHLSYRHGTGAFNAIRAPEEAFGEGTSRFAILATDGSITAPFAIGPLNFRYTGTWRSQANHTPLIGQDRFAIGGRYTVRGFDGESSLVAERGWLVRNELAIPLGASTHELYTGLDRGAVGGPSSSKLVGRSLTGGVVGLRAAVARVQYDVFLGAPIRKPEGFNTARLTSGFSLSVNF